MSTVQFRLAGHDAALAEALADQLDALFGQRPTTHAAEAEAATAGTRATDPVALAALILSIPSALVAAADLADRMRLGEKVERLIAWARRRESDREIWVVLPTGRVLELSKASAADLIGEPEDSA